MRFKLIINGSGARTLDELILTDAINQLQSDSGNFIILEPKIPIQNNVYMQAMYDENRGFEIETRFIFSSDHDFKHYSYSCKDIEEVKTIFLDYYKLGKLPVIANWIEDTNSFEEEFEADMLKLYKQINGKLHYFEFWLSDQNQLTTHEGIVGDVGESEEFDFTDDDLPIKIQMAKIASDYKELGYQEIEDLIEIVIQYRYKEGANSVKKLLDKRHKVEDLMNECLGWTGNGHCDGADIGSGTTNIFCNVVDKDIAFETIVDVLKENDLFSGVRIAYADEVTEEYVMLHPKGAVFDL